MERICKNCGSTKILKVYGSNHKVSYVCNDCEYTIADGTICPVCDGTGKGNIEIDYSTIKHFDSFRPSFKDSVCVACSGSGVIILEQL